MCEALVCMNDVEQHSVHVLLCISLVCTICVVVRVVILVVSSRHCLMTRSQIRGRHSAIRSTCIVHTHIVVQSHIYILRQTHRCTIQHCPSSMLVALQAQLRGICIRRARIKQVHTAARVLHNSNTSARTLSTVLIS